MQKMILYAGSLVHALRVADRARGRLRSQWFTLRFRAAGAHVGKRIWVNRGVQVTVSRSARLHIGDRVSLVLQSGFVI
jgi:hypothetical protein